MTALAADELGLRLAIRLRFVPARVAGARRPAWVNHPQTTPARIALYVRNMRSWANAQPDMRARCGLRNRVRSRMYVRSSPAIPRAVSLAQATRLFEMQWFTSRRKRDSLDAIVLSLRRIFLGRTFALTFAEAACCKDRRKRE